MKADGVDTRILNDIFVSAHQPKLAKKIKTTSVSPPSINKVNMDSAGSIERADQIAATVSKKLQTMSNLLAQIENEQNDIIREQLARFFNVLKAFIDEALHPTGDWSTDQIFLGKSVNVNSGDNGVTVAVQGERVTTGNFNIRELSKSPANGDLQVMMQSITKAQTAVKKLRNNLASARSQIAHHSKGSAAITL